MCELFYCNTFESSKVGEMNCSWTFWDTWYFYQTWFIFYFLFFIIYFYLFISNLLNVWQESEAGHKDPIYSYTSYAFGWVAFASPSDKKHIILIASTKQSQLSETWLFKPPCKIV